jgi:hypothetical protein
MPDKNKQAHPIFMKRIILSIIILVIPVLIFIGAITGSLKSPTEIRKEQAETVKQDEERSRIKYILVKGKLWRVTYALIDGEWLQTSMEPI